MNAEAMVGYWIRKATEDLASARDNLKAGRLSNAVRDAYYSCFHGFSAVLLRREKVFRKHKEVRAALHRDFVRTRMIDTSWGKHYDWLFDNRQKADYRPLVEFDTEQVEEIIEQSQVFLEEMGKLLES